MLDHEPKLVRIAVATCAILWFAWATISIVNRPTRSEVADDVQHAIENAVEKYREQP